MFSTKKFPEGLRDSRSDNRQQAGDVVFIIERLVERESGLPESFIDPVFLAFRFVLVPPVQPSFADSLTF